MFRVLHSVQDLLLRIFSRLPVAVSLAGIQWQHHIGRSVVADLPRRSFFALRGADVWRQISYLPVANTMVLSAGEDTKARLAEEERPRR